MDLQTTIGLGLLTLLFGAIAMVGAPPQNRLPYAMHIAFVTGLSYVIANLT
jgi:hypothetical protein